MAGTAGSLRVFEHDLPPGFGRWCDAGVFEALHEHFHAAGEISAILVDSTIVRAHSCAAGAPKKKADKPQRASGGAGVGLPQN